jgi:putative phage-type endonuclease
LKLTEKIEILRNIPQPEQRTEEWYITRYNLITASNAYKCFENETTQNSIIYEKCKPYEVRSQTNFTNLNSPMHWGQKYEPLSVSIYEKRFNTKIEDFGCIPHSKYTFLGASPDGINVDISNDRYGRMLEIKNIVNRDIVDEPKKEYWVQMQLQMEVCNLNECDFLETRFKEYDNYEDFKNDGTFTHTSNGLEKGVMILFIKNNKPYYEHSPLGANEEEYNNWEKNTMNNNKEHEFISINYWYLHEFSCKLVLRNKKWFHDNIYKIEETWNLIVHDRINGYEHRAPQKRIKKETTNKIQGCLITINGNINEVITNLTTVSELIENEKEETKVSVIENNSETTPKPNTFRIHTESFDETKPDNIF